MCCLDPFGIEAVLFLSLFAWLKNIGLCCLQTGFCIFCVLVLQVLRLGILCVQALVNWCVFWKKVLCDDGWWTMKLLFGFWFFFLQVLLCNFSVPFVFCRYRFYSAGLGSRVCWGQAQNLCFWIGMKAKQVCCSWIDADEAVPWIWMRTKSLDIFIGWKIIRHK